MQRVFYAKLGVDTPTLLVARGLSSIHVPLYITALIHYPMLRRTETRSSFGVSLMRECTGLGSIPLSCLLGHHCPSADNLADYFGKKVADIQAVAPPV